MAEKKQFVKDAVIFNEGDWEMCLYDIVSGTVGIYANYGKLDQQLLTELEPGKCFGEMGLIDAMPRSATAVALADTEVNVIKSEDFVAYLEGAPEKVVEIFKNLSSRLRDLSAEYVETCRTIAEYVDAEEEKKHKLWGKIKKYIMVSGQYYSYMVDYQLPFNYTNFDGWY